jgi:hypothetical protein
MIHPPTKYQPKIISRLGIIDRKGNTDVSRFGPLVVNWRIRSGQFYIATHLCPMIHPPTKYQPKIISCLGIIDRKGTLTLGYGQWTAGDGHAADSIKHPLVFDDGDA